MKPYQILEHTADLRIRVLGKTKEELFLNALKGMMDYLKSPERKDKNEKIAKRTVRISSPDWTALLVDFLSEALALADINREAYHQVEYVNFPRPVADAVRKKTGELILEARLVGEKIQSFDRDIKAVTYHRLEVKQNKEGLWEATIVFDI